MPKKGSIFGRTAKQRAEAKMLGRIAAGKDPFKNGKPVKVKTATRKPTKTIPAIKKSKIQNLTQSSSIRTLDKVPCTTLKIKI